MKTIVLYRADFGNNHQIGITFDQILDQLDLSPDEDGDQINSIEICVHSAKVVD
jgi:hypothetical protein